MQNKSPNRIRRITGTKNAESNNTKLFLYPNPAKSQVNISVSNYSGEIINYYVYDVTGRKKLDKTSCSPIIKINVNKLTPGTYIVEIRIKNNIFQKKFTKTH